MSEPFIGEIRMFAGNYAPQYWAFCDGQLLSVSQNDALFSLLGTIYGGDGRTTFGLPDMRGRVPVHAGQGPGLSRRRLGSKAGTEKEALANNQLPLHDHQLYGTNDRATTRAPGNNMFAQADFDIYAPGTKTVDMHTSCIDSTGSSNSHTNLQPYLCINFIIALTGSYPNRH